ncbi:MAG: COX15/CtaA family protein, partial [Acidobacteria bacterium]|nr:COX15/CtaA family protein [Acidobacteriota bacterium]
MEEERSLATGTTSRSYVLALGFATTVAAWAVAYSGRLPALMAPSWLIGVGMLLCLLGGGFVAGRLVPDRPQAGALVGLLSSALNMLILGSLLSSAHSHRIVPDELLWIPGSLLLGAAVGGLGGLLGRLGEVRRRAEPDWPALLAKVAAAATFLLVIAGGLVTSNEAGLAVVDWPDSFGYNMFLYPLSRMTGGIYYEHAHRLFGSLVGLTTLVLALLLWRVETRRWVKRLAGLAVIFVVVQGILGGLRVTGHFTMSSLRAETRPDLALAVVHGISGQLFLALMVALAVVVSRSWKAAGPAARVPSSRVDRKLLAVLLGALLVQLVLGALQRHLSWGLWYHVGMAVV